MIVVADTSPINYLILIEEIDILTKMYGRVVIPRAVRDELLRPSAPEMVRAWIGQLPIWLEVHTPVNAPDALLVKLDAQSHLSRFSPVEWWGSLVEVYSAINRLHRNKEITDLDKQGAAAHLRLLSHGWRETFKVDTPVPAAFPQSGVQTAP